MQKFLIGAVVGGVLAYVGHRQALAFFNGIAPEPKVEAAKKA